VFLGYNLHHKGYRCLHVPSGRLYISRNVVFDESRFPFATPSPPASSSQPVSLPTSLLIPSCSPPSCCSGILSFPILTYGFPIGFPFFNEFLSKPVSYSLIHSSMFGTFFRLSSSHGNKVQASYSQVQGSSNWFYFQAST
jgi:hypothetical protein